MKQNKFFEFLEKYRSNPNLMRKIKIFAAVGVVGFFIMGALTIWAGISLVKYVAFSANQAIQSPIAQSHVETLKTELTGLAKLQPINCWSQVQTLLAVQPWLERPAIAHLANLKVACFEQKPTACQGLECEQMKNLINSAEGSAI